VCAILIHPATVAAQAGVFKGRKSCDGETEFRARTLYLMVECDDEVNACAQCARNVERIQRSEMAHGQCCSLRDDDWIDSEQRDVGKGTIRFNPRVAGKAFVEHAPRYLDDGQL
jgi:hypothetical protein